MTGVPVADSARLDVRVQAERVQALFDRNSVAQATVLLNSLVVTLVLWGPARPARLLPWLAAVWLVAAGRLAAAARYRRAGRAPEVSPRWARVFTLGAALNGVAWGLAPLLLPRDAPLAELLFLAFVLAGMTAGGALSNASHPPAFLAFTVPALLPVTATFVVAGGRLQLGMAVMLTVFAGAVWAISRSGGRALVQATRLRLRNAELAEHLAADAANLERRVAERTSQLEASVAREREVERQLVNSMRLASLGTLAAAVAHEVNSPLAYVGSNLAFVRQELGRGASDPELQAAMLAALEDAGTGLDRVKTIVRHLNDASRVELHAGAQPVDVHAALELAIGIAGREIEARATLHRDYGDVPAVTAGHVPLVQVFLNLLLNATESFPDGAHAAHHRIRVATRPDATTGQVVVEVADTGRGIAGGDVERIWQPFFTTKGPASGNGLGLPICRDILSRYGARIEVQSVEGAGSTFSVWLKAAPRYGSRTSATTGK